MYYKDEKLNRIDALRICIGLTNSKLGQDGTREFYVLNYDLFTVLEHDVFYNKGITLARRGKYAEAIRCFDKVIGIKPDYYNATVSKGNALDELGRYTKAIECYDRAIEIEPDYSSAFYNKGITLAKLGRYEEAIVYYDRAIEIEPHCHEMISGKAAALNRLGRHPEALECTDFPISTFSKDLPPHIYPDTKK